MAIIWKDGSTIVRMFSSLLMMGTAIREFVPSSSIRKSTSPSIGFYSSLRKFTEYTDFIKHIPLEGSKR